MSEMEILDKIEPANKPAPQVLLGYVNCYTYGLGKLTPDFSVAVTTAALCKSRYVRTLRYYNSGSFGHITPQEFGILDSTVYGQEACITFPAEGGIPGHT